jgi:hypothetical protein
MKFVELLNLILSFGPRIPEIMERVQHIIAEIQELVELVHPGLFAAAAAVELTAEEAALESQILAACPANENFAGPFQSLFAFLKAHPELIALLLKFLV